MKEESLFPSKDAAFAAEGEIYQHYKGGVYRLVQKGIKYCEDIQPHVLYEHLWPHDHGFWFRSEKDFFGTIPTGEPRFKLIKKGA